MDPTVRRCASDPDDVVAADELFSILARTSTPQLHHRNAETSASGRLTPGTSPTPLPHLVRVWLLGRIPARELQRQGS